MSDPDAAAAGRAAFPLTQEQILLARALLDQQRRATAGADTPPPRGEVRKVNIVSALAGPVPVIRARHGYTTVVFVTDASGAPWPIQEAIMDRRLATAGGSQADHVLYVSPSEQYLRGNAVLRLRGRTEPMILDIREGGTPFDHMVDIRLAAAGPNVDPAALTRPEVFSAGDDALSGVLTGRPPPGATRVTVRGGGINDRAWRLGDDLLLITDLDLLSPGPSAVERGGDRWAYRLPMTPLALVSRDGRIQRLSFEAPPSQPAAAPEAIQ